MWSSPGDRVKYRLCQTRTVSKCITNVISMFIYRKLNQLSSILSPVMTLSQPSDWAIICAHLIHSSRPGEEITTGSNAHHPHRDLWPLSRLAPSKCPSHPASPASEPRRPVTQCRRQAKPSPHTASRHRAADTLLPRLTMIHNLMEREGEGWQPHRLKFKVKTISILRLWIQPQAARLP